MPFVLKRIGGESVIDSIQTSIDSNSSQYKGRMHLGSDGSVGCTVATTRGNMASMGTYEALQKGPCRSLGSLQANTKIAKRDGLTKSQGRSQKEGRRARGV